MSGTESVGSEATDIVLYLFFLGPAVEWCLKSKRVNKDGQGNRRGIALAILLLASVAAVKITVDLAGSDPNYFQVLGVSASATPAEVRRAYKQMSLLYHPDKNKDDPNAQEMFQRIHTAYEVLKDSNQRDVYNKFGAWGIEEQRTGANGGLLSGLMVFYVIWVVMAFLLTMGKSNKTARTWTYSGLLALGVFEYQTRVMSYNFSIWPFQSSTTNEKVEILHKLFPPFMHGARMISQVLFQDIEMYNKMLLEQLHLKIDTVAMMLKTVHQEMEGVKKSGQKLQLPPSTTGPAQGWQFDGAAAKSKEAAEAKEQKEQQGEEAQKGAPQYSQQQIQQAKTGNLIWLIGVYFLFQWMMGKEQ